MDKFEPKDANFEARARDSFARQGIMETLGARMTDVEEGLVRIEVDYHDGLSQQHGFFHAGVTATIADSAGGYAAQTLYPADVTVLTTEFKLNLLAPAHGERLVATGRVIKPGRTLTVTDMEVAAISNGKEKLCAKGLQTIIGVAGRPEKEAAG
ncbi:MAG: PaaI family thioesterase [Rhodovibrionaceae bacterium]|nr:PaaI family thioesterase [Rhodovibrionaceae bacterium]